MTAIERIDWGVLDYSAAHAKQLARVEQRKVDEVDDALIVVEHPHVITVGRSRAARANVLLPGDVPVVEIERGGDATYHGPGQVVVYPIMALAEGERDLHRYLRNLEDALIATCNAFGVESGREVGKTGVWTQGRKLASIGIACRRWVTFHGVALNVATDLSQFARINPCGFEASVMTSLERERSQSLNQAEVATCLVKQMASTLGRQLRAN